jgi:hypothetical protein
MATLVLGQTLETRENAVLLDPNLRPGDYRAQLVVVGPSGVSEPAEIRIRVLARRVDPIDPRIDPRPVPVRPVTPVTPVVPVSPVAPTRSVKPKRKAKPKAKPAVAAKKKAGRSPPQKPKRK